MIVQKEIKELIDSYRFLMYLLAFSLSTLLIGYAISSISFGLFFFFSLRYCFFNGKRTHFKLALFLPILLYAFFVLSFTWSVDKEQTLKGLGRMITLVAIPLAFIFIPKVSPKNYHLVLKFTTYSNAIIGLAFVINSLFKYVKESNIGVFLYHDLVSLLDLNAIYVSLVFIISLFYLLSLDKKSRIEKVLIPYFVLLIILLSSKLMIAILFIGLLISFLRSYKDVTITKKLISITILIVVGLIAVSTSIYKRYSIEKLTNVQEVFEKESFGRVYYWTGSSIRLFQLRILKEQIEENPILIKGFGLFASKTNLVEKHKQYNTYDDYHDYNYHNQYAQMLSELGLIGLLLLILLILIIFNNAFRSGNYLFIMFGITITLLFFTESMLWRQRGLFLFISLYSFLYRTQYKVN